MTGTRITALVALVLAGAATPARADLVYFASGRSMSVKATRINRESLILTLRGGGEIVCDRTTISRIERGLAPWTPVRRLTMLAAGLDSVLGFVEHRPRFDPPLDG